MESIDKMDRLSYIEAIRSIRLKCALNKLGIPDAKALNRIPVTQTTPGVAGQKHPPSGLPPCRKPRHFRQPLAPCPTHPAVQGQLGRAGVPVEGQPKVGRARRQRTEQVRDELKDNNPYCTPAEGLTDKFRAALGIVDDIYRRYEQGLPLHQRPNTMARQKAKVNQVLKNVLGPNESILPTKLKIAQKADRDEKDALDPTLPAVPQLSFVEYVKNWKDIEFIKILTRFKFQEIDRIETEIQAKEKTVEVKRNKFADESARLEDLLLAHEREATMATQKAHGEKMAADRKAEEVRALHGHVGELHRKVMKQLGRLDDMRLWQRFFFQMSPVWWRIRHDYLHPVPSSLKSGERLQDGDSNHLHPVPSSLKSGERLQDGDGNHLHPVPSSLKSGERLQEGDSNHLHPVPSSLKSGERLQEGDSNHLHPVQSSLKSKELLQDGDRNYPHLLKQRERQQVGDTINPHPLKIREHLQDSDRNDPNPLKSRERLHDSDSNYPHLLKSRERLQDSVQSLLKSRARLQDGDRNYPNPLKSRERLHDSDSNYPHLLKSRERLQDSVQSLLKSRARLQDGDRNDLDTIAEARESLTPTEYRHSGLREGGLDQEVNNAQHPITEEGKPLLPSTTMYSHQGLQDGIVIQDQVADTTPTILPAQQYDYPRLEDQHGQPVLPSLYVHPSLQDCLSGDLVEELNYLCSVVQEEERRPKTLYFQEPEQLLLDFVNAENTNLGMIQDNQKTEMQTELLRLETCKNKKQYDREIAQLEESTSVLYRNIDYKEQHAGYLETLTKMYGLGHGYEECERALILRNLQTQVSELFTEIFAGNVSNVRTDIQFVDIEREFVRLTEELDSMPLKLVHDLKDKMISDEKKMLEEEVCKTRQIFEFHRLAAQMARALAPPPTAQQRIQRIVKSRSAPCRRVKRRVPVRSKSAANSADRQCEDEDARYFESLLKLS